jgi:AcrR family transcriptional regulator
MTDGRTERARSARERRRAEILDAAAEVFARSGYHGTSVADLVEAAGVARGTFYLYFQSKNAVFIELLDKLTVDLRAEIRGVDTREGAAPPREQLVAIVVRLLKAVETNRATIAILLREAVGLGEDVDARLARFYQEIEEYLALTLVLGQRAGMVRDGLDVPVIAACMLGSVRRVLEGWLATGQEAPLDAERIAPAIVDFNLIGVSSL